MKLRSIILSMILLFSIGFASGQVTQITGDEIKKMPVQDFSDIFDKGTYRYNLNQGITIRGGSLRHEGDKYGNRTQYNITVGTDYFVADNWMVGGRLLMQGDKEKFDQPSTTEKNSDWMLYASGGYGWDLTDDIKLIPKVTLGYGQTNDKYKDSGGEDKYTYNNFHAIAQVDVPFNIYRNYIYVTPSAGYLFGHSKYEDNKEIENGFFAMANVEIFMGCEQHVCDCERGWQIPEDRYGAGLLEIGGRANTAIQFGGYTNTWTGSNGMENKTKYSYNNIDFQGSAAYYPLPNFGTGLAAVFNSGTQKEKDGDYKITSNSYLIRPFAKYHVPVTGPLNNLYGEFGFGFGNQKTQTKGTSYDDTDKHSITQWDVNVGYDYWVNDIMSLGAVVSYANLTSKNTSDDDEFKAKWGGMGFGITWNVFIPTK